jgi:geranylgeranyl reductase family protein
MLHLLKERGFDMKIVVVGAGPVGCYTAQLLKHYGIKTKIIEEHKEIGKPVKCAGIIGKQVFKNTLLPFSEDSIVNQINGALIFYKGDSFLIERQDVAYVIDRERFDKELSKDLEIECGRRLVGIEADGEGYRLETNLGDIYADMVIGADGPRSRVREFIEKESGEENDLRYYYGFQYRVKLEKGIPLDKVNFTQVHTREGNPFFIWIIPEGKKIVRLGIISKDGKGKEELDCFREGLNITLGSEIIDSLAGVIPIGWRGRNVYKNIALVGDAACQVKPLTGGGIYYGLKSAEILAEGIRNNRLDEYDRKLKEKFGKEIKFGLKARKLYEEIQDKELKNMFLLFKKNAGLIERVADFENHSIIFKEILKNPKIFIDAGKILGRNLRKLREIF